MKGKPPQAIAKIVEGKLEKFYQSYCLLDQGFVKKNSEVTVKEHIGSIAKQLGDEITIRRFVRFQVGETPHKKGQPKIRKHLRKRPHQNGAGFSFLSEISC